MFHTCALIFGLIAAGAAIAISAGERTAFRTVTLAAALTLSPAAGARPTDLQISTFMACMRAAVPIVDKHVGSDSAPEVLAAASEICRSNMPGASDREDVVQEILECGLEPDGSDASPDSCEQDGPDAMYPEAKPAKDR
jgi:hypothetical protein